MIQAKKLRDRNPLLVVTADKYAVRDYVARRIGPQLLIPLIGVTANPGEVRRMDLPRRFVVKATHGNNATLIVQDRDHVDWSAAEAAFARWLDDNWYRYNKEWAYREIPPQLIVEEMIGGEAPPPDYKFFCFRGQPRVIQVDNDRFSDHRRDLFDVAWRRLAVNYAYRGADTTPTAPENLAAMLDVAERLAAEFDFVRVDLYSVGSKAYFGELSHYPEGGMKRFEPVRFDEALAALWRGAEELPAELYDR